MNDKLGGRWFAGALALLVFLVALWVVAALQLDPAAAGSGISLSLRSRLLADYGPDAGGRLGSMRLSIVSDLLQDLGFGPDNAGETSESLRISMLTPVPTATALDFFGQPPPTLTATNTPRPTQTQTPPPTATNTRRPTSTHTATGTPKPDNTAAATTTGGCCDNQDPQLSGGTPSVADGSSFGCTMVVTVTGIRAFDPGPSSGMNWIKLKYNIDGSSYVFSTPLTLVSGGWVAGPGGPWDAIYQGTITIDHDTVFGSSMSLGKGLARPALRLDDTDTPTPTATHTPSVTPDPAPTEVLTDHDVELYMIAEDNEGNSDYVLLASYTMSCH